MTFRERFSEVLTRVRSLVPGSNSLDILQSKGGRRAVVATLSAYSLLTLGLGFYWSMSPDSFDVTENRAHYLESTDKSVTGAATTAALLEVTRLLLEKPGGYISNDITPPGAFMDNMPSWEYGVLIQSRDLARALREVLSRSQSQSQELLNPSMMLTYGTPFHPPTTAAPPPPPDLVESFKDQYVSP